MHDDDGYADYLDDLNDVLIDQDDRLFEGHNSPRRPGPASSPGYRQGGPPSRGTGVNWAVVLFVVLCVVVGLIVFAVLV
jgi:hypothetical protein